MRWFYRLWPERREAGKRALVLSGGGVIGGMYEVGVLAALDEELQGCCVNNFDIFVGSSAGSVVASLIANGVRPTDLYRILGEGLPDPMNFSRGSVYDRRAFSGAAGRPGQRVWAVGKNILTGLRSSWPDMLAKAQGSLPAGFFTVQQLEVYMRSVFQEKGLSNDFRTLPHTLLIPARAPPRKTAPPTPPRPPPPPPPPAADPPARRGPRGLTRGDEERVGERPEVV